METRQLPRKRRKHIKVDYNPNPPKAQQERFAATWAALTRNKKKSLASKAATFHRFWREAVRQSPGGLFIAHT